MGGAFSNSLSVRLSNVLDMGNTGFIDTENALAHLDAAMTAVAGLDDFCRVGNDDILAVASKLEVLSRRVFAVQIRMADEIHSRSLASRLSCTSTSALLRQVLNITITDANTRIRAGAALIPQDLPSGGETSVVLPALAKAVEQGAVDAEHIKVILGFEKKLPGKLDVSKRLEAHEFLLGHALGTDARNLQAIADHLENAINPDGTLHDTDPHERMELIVGRRSRSTGLTPIRGRLDDLAIEILHRALDSFTKPGHQPCGGSQSSDGTDGTEISVRNSNSESEIGVSTETGETGSPASNTAGGVDGSPRNAGGSSRRRPDGESGSNIGSDIDIPRSYTDSDIAPKSQDEASTDIELTQNSPGRDTDGSGPTDTRPHATRLAHALIEALQALLNSGQLPTQGGERPHITAVIDWDMANAHETVVRARLSTGNYLTPAQTSQLLCDAQITPAVLSGTSEVLDLGRTKRTFPPALRRALILRDGGCAWPHCTRPPEWTDAHHINWWHRDGGHTSLVNGVLLCQRHHTEVHQDQWKILMNEDGHPDFIPPVWLDSSQSPQRNTLHHNTNQRE